MVERFVGLGVSPSLDRDVGEHGSVEGPDCGEEVVQGSGVFEDEVISGIEDRLSFGEDLAVEAE